MAFTYLNIGNRIQYALQGFTQDSFYFGQNQYLYDPSLAPFIDRDLAEAVQSQQGATAFAIYPFNRYTRAELFGGYIHMSEEYTNPALQALSQQYQTDVYGNPLFRNGHMMPLGISLVRETTIFREFGPVAGNTFKLTFEGSPAISDNWLSRRTVDVDLRHYHRMVANGVFATRFKGFKSWGRNPDFMYFGGNGEMRGYQYLEFLGQKAFFADAELRFPLIQAMLTPVGVLGGLRGAYFINLGGGGFNGQQFTVFRTSSEQYTPFLGYGVDTAGNVVPVFGPQFEVSGLRLVDARASYGIGLQSFLLGFPMHFDWSWKTLFNKNWEDLLFASAAFAQDPSGNTSGSSLFRKVKFSFWIGYDF
jgi:outer membrane protein assembly factor BamA